MTKNKNRVILSICAIFVCICSLLCFVPMFKNDKINVYADEVVTQNIEFVGSPLYVYGGTYPFSSNSQNIFMLRSYSFVIDPSTNTLVSFGIHTNSFGIEYNSSVSEFTTSIFEFRQFIGINDTGGYFSTWVTFSNYGSGVVYFGLPISCRIYSSYASNQYVNTFFIYRDANGNEISFNSNVMYDSSDPDFGINYGGIPEMLLSDRTYYFERSLSLTDNQYYNQGYSQGKQDGKNEGLAEGKTQGYNQGFSEGENIGFNNGYAEGVEDSNQYTFMSLLSATIDAPVKYFQSLFNFELLGVNMQGFLTGLFTLCVVVTIFKLCLGG